MKKRNLLLIFLSIMLAFGIGFSHKNNDVTLASSMSPYTVTLYSSDNGVSTGEANVVLQTEDGFIWVGGYGGLQRFDGKNFVSFGASDGMTSNAIRALYEDKNGTLWIGTNDKGLFYYKDGTFTKVQWVDGLNRVARCIAEDGNGRIWFGTSYSGIAYVENGVVHTFSLDFEGENYDTTISTLSYRDGLLWGSSYDGSIFAVNTENLIVKERFAVGELWTGADAYSVLSGSDGKIYVGTGSNQIVILTKYNDIYTAETIDSGALSSINAIYETCEGDIWLCGAKGIGKITDGIYEDLSYIDYTEYLVNIIEDYEHNIWVASSNYGVLYIQHEKVYKVVNTAELTNAETHTICKVGDNIFVGASTGVLSFDKDWKRIENNATSYFAGCDIRDIYYDGSLVYFASQHTTNYAMSGVFTYDPTTDATPVKLDLSFSGYQIRTFASLSDGSFAVGTNKGVDIVKDGAIIDTHTVGTSVLCMLELHDGTLLVGTDGNGIYSLKDGAFKEWANTDTGLSGGVILRMLEDDKNFGNIFVSCGNDTFYGNNLGFAKTAEINVGSGSVVDMFFEDDYIWLFKQSGIIRCLRSEFMDSASKLPSLFFIHKDDGIPGTIAANSWNRFIDNELIICTTNGIGILDVKYIYLNNEKPKVAIVSIYDNDGNSWDGTDSVTLDKNTTKITFSFASLTFDKSTVEYWLEGFDDEHIVKNISDLSAVEYTNLKRGEYKFHLIVVNADGVKSDEIIISVTKEPKFIETGWYYVMIILGVVLVVALIATLLIIRAKRKQKLYKHITDQSIATISGVIDAKDPYTNGHSLRVAEFSVKIAKRMGLKKADCERLNYIALLHDIGKIGVPDKILNKPGHLTDEEFSEIKHHVDIGGEVLSNFTLLEGVTEGALYHHERFDGSGYGKGLKGDDIPLFARIIAVADSFDAMNSSRCYRPAMDIEKIKSELIKGKGTQFDPEIVDVAIAIIDDEIKDKNK